MKKNNNFSGITREQLARMIANGFGGVDKKFAEVHEKMLTKTEFAKAMAGINQRLDGVNNRVDPLANGVAVLKNKVAVLETSKR